MPTRIFSLAGFALFFSIWFFPLTPKFRGPAEKADTWQAQHRWLVGCNFTPSTAINQLEMWQAGAFEPSTFDKEFIRPRA